MVILIIGSGSIIHLLGIANALSATKDATIAKPDFTFLASDIICKMAASITGVRIADDPTGLRGVGA